MTIYNFSFLFILNIKFLYLQFRFNTLQSLLLTTVQTSYNMTTKLSYHKLEAASTPRLTNKATNEQRFWKKYINELLIQSNAPVSSICSNSNEKNLMIFGHGRAISLVDTNSKEIIRKIQNYVYPVTAVSMRRDGLVMATGDQQGRIQVKDTKQKFNLRTFDNHKKKINCLDFHVNDLYSGGQDMMIRLFDVAAGTVIHSYQNAHSDYIKCIKGLENNHLLSAGYDGKIKLFDFRVHQQAQIEFDHGNQVEWFDLFPSNMNFVACGDKKITSWDIRSTKPLFQNSNNKKLLTCIRVLSNGSRIMTSSYDCYLKIYKSDSFEVTYQQKFESPILCFDLNRSGQFLGIGLQNKKILMKSRPEVKEEDLDNQSEKQIQDEIALWLKNNETKGKFAYNDKYFYRGIYSKPQSFDIKFERNQSKKVSQYDKHLKKFEYKKALFLSLRKKNMVIFLSLVDEYQQRGCLDRVLKSLIQSETEQLLAILSQLIHDIRYIEVATFLIEKLIQHQSDVEANGWNLLKDQIKSQIGAIQNLSIVGGMLDLIQKNCNIS